MPALKDLTGKVFGRLRVLHRDLTKKRVTWVCECNCGKETSVDAGNLSSGKIRSCGCFQKECAAQNRRDALTRPVVGSSGPRSHMPEYRAWNAMLNRCLRNADVPHYSGRGITVCDNWLSFDLFYQDMGSRPSSKHSIERVDVNKGYSKENCIWATMKQQIRNRTNTRFIEVDGVTKPLGEWVEIAGVPYYKIHNKMRTMSPADAVKFFLDKVI